MAGACLPPFLIMSLCGGSKPPPYSVWRSPLAKSSAFVKACFPIYILQKLWYNTVREKQKFRETAYGSAASTR